MMGIIVLIFFGSFFCFYFWSDFRIFGYYLINLIYYDMDRDDEDGIADGGFFFFRSWLDAIDWFFWRILGMSKNCDWGFIFEFILIGYLDFGRIFFYGIWADFDDGGLWYLMMIGCIYFLMILILGILIFLGFGGILDEIAISCQITIIKISDLYDMYLSDGCLIDGWLVWDDY